MTEQERHWLDGDGFEQPTNTIYRWENLHVWVRLTAADANALEAQLTQATAHNEHGERWQYLMSLKHPDAIGTAFALLEESFLHHTNERDGWTPDDTCYME